MKIKGFDNGAFMEHLAESFNGFDNPFLRQLVENVLDYAHSFEHISKDQFVYYLCDMIPEVEFGEVAAFMEDACLTADGQRMKQEWLLQNLR